MPFGRRGGGVDREVSAGRILLEQLDELCSTLCLSERQ